MLEVGHPGQLEEDLVVAKRLDHRLGDAERVDPPVNDAAGLSVELGDRDRRAGRQLVGPQLEHELRFVLEVEFKVRLDLCLEAARASRQPEAGASGFQTEIKTHLGFDF